MLTVAAAGTEINLARGDTLVVGRDPTCGLMLDDPLVSRDHAGVYCDDGDWVYEDHESRNGTFLDGEPVHRIVISAPTTLRLGSATEGVTLELLPPVPDFGTLTGRASALIGTLGEVSAVHRPGTIMRIGRAPDNDVVVEDLSVSRYHAQLRTRPDGAIEVVDLDSHNGTYVNGTAARRTTVVDDDLISIGHHLFRLAGGVLIESVDLGGVELEAEGLGVRVKDRPILQGVSFTLPERSVMAVIGPSGAGKTTLLKALTGFRPADEGAVWYGGRDLYAEYADVRQRIGYVPQDDVLHVELDARQALRYSARLRFPKDVTGEERNARTEEVLEELGLARHCDRPIARLSGGQRKRASVGLELLTMPSLLFLDEPTSGLDPGYERSLSRLLRVLADGGRTIVVVTHSVQSLDLCDRVLVLAPGGSTAYFGPPGEATSYFESANYAEVFETLEQGRDVDWAGRYAASRIHDRYMKGRRAAMAAAGIVPERTSPSPPRRQGWFRQLWTLTRRYLAVIGKDRRFLAMLLLQAPILGLIMLQALPQNAFTPSSNPVRFSSASVVLAVVFAGVTWLGLSNSVREIVKEAPIHRRERASGLSPSAYLASKVLVLGSITALQAAALALIATARQGGVWGPALFGPGRLELATAAALTGLAAVALGLLVSALARNADQATALLPLLLLLQLLLSGGFAGVVNQPVLRQASYLASAQWGLSAGAATVDLNRLQVFNDCLFAAAPSGSLGPDDVELTILCVRLGLSRSEATFESLRTFLINARESTPEEADAVIEDLDRVLLAGGEGDAEAVLEQLSAPTVTDAEIARIVTIVERSGTLRFWEQTPRDWLINIGVLAGLTLVSLGGAWLVLVRRDQEG